MELLRIVAMLLVLVVHADFVSLGVPSRHPGDFYSLMSEILRVAIEMGALVCVNIFVLISGWFTIRPTAKGITAFLFQVVFLLMLCFIFMGLTGLKPFTIGCFAGSFCLTESMWFVKAYAGLYLLAPLLNLYCERVDERTLRITVVGFYIYQTMWGFIGNNGSVANGYSVLSFMGLYLLARYMRLYYTGSRHKSWLWLYGLTVVLNTIAFFFFPKEIAVCSYANPLVVLGSLGVMMFFTGLNIRQNYWINAVAATCFGVYLVHASPAVMSSFQASVVWASNLAPGVLSLFTIAMVLAAFFVIGCVADLLRIYVWRLVSIPVTDFLKRVFDRLSSRGG